MTWGKICEVVDLMRVQDVDEDSGSREYQRLLQEAVEDQRGQTTGIDDVRLRFFQLSLSRCMTK